MFSLLITALYALKNRDILFSDKENKTIRVDDVSKWFKVPV